MRRSPLQCKNTVQKKKVLYKTKISGHKTLKSIELTKSNGNRLKEITNFSLKREINYA